MILNIGKFLESGKPRWDELEAMLDGIDEAPRTPMTFAEIVRFRDLYERVCCDLTDLDSAARAPELREQLSRLASRARAVINAATWRKSPDLRAPQSRISNLKSRITNFTRAFPAVFRRRIAAFAFACAIMGGGAFFGAVVTVSDPSSRHVLMVFGHDESNPDERVAQAEKTSLSQSGDRSSFSAYLFRNNVRVSLLSLVGGICFGAITVLLLFYNGAVMGAICVDYLMHGQGVFLAGWLLPHGVVEIPAILLSGQAGLVIGGVLFGRRKRADFGSRMREALPDIVTLTVGIVLLLGYAALVESFLSQYHSPKIYPLKIAFGLLEFAILALWLFSGKKGRADGGGVAK